MQPYALPEWRYCYPYTLFDLIISILKHKTVSDIVAFFPSDPLFPNWLLKGKLLGPPKINQLRFQLQVKK